MTPQYVIRQALCRDPHCFSAHVRGRGYVNKGEHAAQRPDFLRQYWSTAEIEIKNMLWAPGYAEGGYDTPRKGILFANWNNLPRDIDQTLERMGFAIEWADEWNTCEECNKAVRTSPNSHCWEPYWAEAMIEQGSFICLGCYVPDDDETESEVEA